jgi:hypothetical protein
VYITANGQTAPASFPSTKTCTSRQGPLADTTLGSGKYGNASSSAFKYQNSSALFPDARISTNARWVVGGMTTEVVPRGVALSTTKRLAEVLERVESGKMVLAGTMEGKLRVAG